VRLHLVQVTLSDLEQESSLGKTQCAHEKKGPGLSLLTFASLVEIELRGWVSRLGV
jgi:hypothetical protein